VTVNLATPNLLLASSAASSFFSNPVPFTATLSSANGAASGAALPTGSVTFFDGTTQLASVLLSSGSAAYATSTMAAGTHPITAVYSGDSNYVALTSPPLNEVIENFMVAPPSGGSTSATVAASGRAGSLLAGLQPTQWRNISGRHQSGGQRAALRSYGHLLACRYSRRCGPQP
jgi:hypothetical protein